MDWLFDPFGLDFMRRGLVAGILAAVTCSLVGIWVILRGLSFMGDALAHGIVPGIAVAVVAGFDVSLGALAGAAITVGGVSVVSRYTRLPEDTGIGLLFVGMLALGVIIMSRLDSFAIDLTTILFGAVLGVSTRDVAVQAIAAAVALVCVVLLYRPFLVLAFDERKAQMLGLRPRLARSALLGLVALAVVTSFRAVGALLVFGLLIAPPATAVLLSRRVPVMMAVSGLTGAVAVVLGLVLSYHFDLAAGATIAFTAVAAFFAVLALREAALTMRRLGGARSAPRGG